MNFPILVVGEMGEVGGTGIHLRSLLPWCVSSPNVLDLCPRIIIKKQDLGRHGLRSRLEPEKLMYVVIQEKERIRSHPT